MKIKVDYYDYTEVRYQRLKTVTFWALITIVLATAIVCINSCTIPIPAFAEIIAYSDEVIAQAIFKTENSKRYPYGVKSVKTRGNVAFAHKVCLNSIRNAKKRYIQAGMPGDFIAFMGKRYSPPNINPNWVKLVHYFLAKAK